MALDVKYPQVQPIPPRTDFPVSLANGAVVESPAAANVMCLLPGAGSEPGWFRRPPWPPYYLDHQFVSTADAELSPGQRPLPYGHAFELPRFALSGLGLDDGWREDRHPRFLVDLTGDGRADIVAFGDDGVWTALGDGRGGFSEATFVLAGFAPNAGGWALPDFPRQPADLTGDGRADIVGFGDDGVWTALGDGGGGFSEPRFVLNDFGRSAGGWSSWRHPRVVTDLTGDGRADIVGFADDGVRVSLGDGAGGFGPSVPVLDGLGFSARWRTDEHTRVLADLTGDGRPDIVALGDDGVWTALGDGGGGFAPARYVLAEYGTQQGWTKYDRVRPMVADVTGDGRADLLGFHEDGVLLARGDGAGGFQPPEMVLPDFRREQYVAWEPWRHPRMCADLTGNGAADIVGFSEHGTWVAVFDTAGPLAAQLVVHDFGRAQGWIHGWHSVLAADLTGSGRADLVGFKDAGVYVSLNLGSGPVPVRQP